MRFVQREIPAWIATPARGVYFEGMTRRVLPIHIVGGGLAGSEAAWQIARRGVPVVLHEMRPDRATAAHKTGQLAELVCSNSFRSDDAEASAIGLLHAEMRRLGSLVMQSADAHKLPAGGALAVDRDGFAAAITTALEAEPLIEIRREEIAAPFPEWDNVIIATGPLTSPALADALRALTGEDALAFFDAIVPIVHRDSIDFDVAWFQSRYDKSGPAGSGADYINCPMTRAQYDAFVDALLSGEKIAFREFEEATPYFDGCLPIEVMAERGRETLRHGPMKPFGLTDPRRPGRKPYAVVQLRQDNKLGTLFNIVGFQTKLKHGEQTRIFRTIPGLDRAEFARLGGLHRNTFLNSPKLLNATLRLEAEPQLRFAGQITGCEGYVESAATGLLAGRFAAAERLGETPMLPPVTTAHGALLGHITGGHIETIDKGPCSFQPMNINFGLFAPSSGVARNARKQALCARALADLDGWIGGALPHAADKRLCAKRLRMAAGEDLKELGGRWRDGVVLKRDVFSTIERGRFQTDSGEVEAVLRRLDQVPWWSRGLAYLLFWRERRALATAGKLGIAPPLLFAGRNALVRGWIEGVPLHIAKPHGDVDYFRSAKAALRTLHRSGLSHNDLAKEQNWLYANGRPYLTDFQLASCFRRRSLIFRIARYEDLRHLLKHKRRYAPEALTSAERRVLARKSVITRAWMATGKKLYYAITRGLNITDREGRGSRFSREAPQIAARLRTHPQVSDVAVVPFPDRRAGTGLYAFVEGKATDRELIDFLGGKGPEHLQVVDALPRNSQGEVRSEILELVAMNQLDLIAPLIKSDAERAIVRRIVSERRNLRDRFAF